jgi:glycosyltransferase involved in cell wall biosynthesis
MKIFVVVPAYNEAKRIGEVLSGLEKTKLPVVVVDDGSSDRTFEIAKKYKVTALRHKINLGKGSAMKTGAEAAFSIGAEAVIFMDSDGQHKVEDLPKFTKALKTGKHDIVFGSRNLDLGVPLERYLGNKFASVLVNVLFGIYVSDLVSGYRAITKKAFYKLNWESTGYGVETEIVVRCGKLGLTHCEVPVATLYYDKFKGVSVIDAIGIFFDVFRWRIQR